MAAGLGGSLAGPDAATSSTDVLARIDSLEELRVALARYAQGSAEVDHLLWQELGRTDQRVIAQLTERRGALAMARAELDDCRRTDGASCHLQAAHVQRATARVEAAERSARILAEARAGLMPSRRTFIRNVERLTGAARDRLRREAEALRCSLPADAGGHATPPGDGPGTA